MSVDLHAYDVRHELELLEPLDFTRRSRLKHVDKVFRSEITNVVELTEQEKLFHIRLLEPEERESFTFMPGQFVMVELPGYGEVPISISNSHLGLIGNVYPSSTFIAQRLAPTLMSLSAS